MNQAPGKAGILSTALLVQYLLFFTGLIFSFRALSSMSTGLLVITGMIYTRRQSGLFFPPGLKSFFFLACTGYLLLQAVLFMMYDNTVRGSQELLLKTGLAGIPLAVYYTTGFAARYKKKLISAYLLILAAGALYCLLRTTFYYADSGDRSHFFYHALVQPLKQHAVYFSLLVFFAITCLLNGYTKRSWYINKAVHLSLSIFFLCFLVLLSSKLVLSFTVLTVAYFLYINLRTEENNRKLIIIATILFISGLFLLFSTRNPVSNRFTEMLKGDIGMAQREHFRTDEYFNGLQFRLLQWKLVPEILTEMNAWPTGVGAGRSQNLLTGKYIEKNMYTGEPGDLVKGYGLYNTHNQWLESLLKNGIAGLILLLLMNLALLRLAWKKKKRIISFTVILLLFYSFAEAILETQYGLVLYLFFPLFFSVEDEPTL
jgi:O-antigen ligase